MDVIEQAVRGFTKCYKQYYVKGLRIDLYLPDFKIAVECDEHGHVDRDPEYETMREQEIATELHCKFIRYDPDSPGFNIGDVVNRVFRIGLKFDSTLIHQDS